MSTDSSKSLKTRIQICSLRPLGGGRWVVRKNIFLFLSSYEKNVTLNIEWIYFIKLHFLWWLFGGHPQLCYVLWDHSWSEIGDYIWCQGWIFREPFLQAELLAHKCPRNISTENESASSTSSKSGKTVI